MSAAAIPSTNQSPPFFTSGELTAFRLLFVRKFPILNLTSAEVNKSHHVILFCSLFLLFSLCSCMFGESCATVIYDTTNLPV